MFYPAKMCKIRVIERKANLGRTVELLEKFGGAQIKKFDFEGVQNEKALDSLGSSSESLLRTEAVLAALPAKETIARIPIKEACQFIESSEARKIVGKIISIQHEKEKLQSEIDVLEDEKSRIRHFEPFHIDFSSMDFETIDIAAGIVQGQNKIRFEKAIAGPAILKHTEKRYGPKATIHLVAVSKGNEGALQELSKAGFERMPLPRIGGMPSKEIGKAEEKIIQLEKKIGALGGELEKISRDYYLKFCAAGEYLKMEAEKAALPSNFGGTEHTIIVEAYLPEKNFSGFEKFAKSGLNENIYIRKFSSEQLHKEHEQPPTLLEHSRILEPFEFMTKYVSLPKSNEIDPTIIFLIFFPLFYAMMVGDFIYGIISFLIAKWLIKKFKPGGIMNPVAKIWMWSAIPTIVFGVIYDEYAGMPHKEIFEKLGFGAIELYHGIERIHNVQFLLVICVLLGIVTMGIGFLLGFLNARAHGNNKHALAKLGWFVVLCSGTLLLSSTLFKALPEAYVLPSAIALIAGLAAIVKGEGIMGLIELPSLLSNVLSFTRIIAVGLVGTVIGTILNGMAYPSPEKGLLLILLIPLYAFGHLFNAGMAMFESLVQGARLNYVEFYSKFFEGGGKEFVPFKFERKYLKD